MLIEECVWPSTDTSPQQRLALAVIERAIRDLHPSPTSSSREIGFHESAVEFLNGSAGFYFWTHVLEQDPEWLLRRLHAQTVEGLATSLKAALTAENALL